MLVSHLLSIIVGDGVRLCNYPFNYPDQCFHYPLRTPARNQCGIPPQYLVAVHIGNTLHGHRGHLMIELRSMLKKKPRHPVAGIGDNEHHAFTLRAAYSPDERQPAYIGVRNAPVRHASGNLKAPIDREQLTGDIVGSRGRKEQHRACDIGGHADAAQGHASRLRDRSVRLVKLR